MQTYIPNNWIDDPSLTNEGLFFLVFIQCFYASIDLLYLKRTYSYYFYKDTKLAGASLQRYNKTIDLLVSQGYLIKKDEDYQKNPERFEKPAWYITLTLEELIKVANVSKRNRYKMIRFYLTFKRYFDCSSNIHKTLGKNYVGKIYDMSISFLVDKVSLTRTTCDKYIQCLIDNRIICKITINNLGKRRFIYALYEDKELAKNFVTAYLLRQNNPPDIKTVN